MVAASLLLGPHSGVHRELQLLSKDSKAVLPCAGPSGGFQLLHYSVVSLKFLPKLSAPHLRRASHSEKFTLTDFSNAFYFIFMETGISSCIYS